MADWQATGKLAARSYICGHCGHTAGPNSGYHSDQQGQRIYICTYCSRPTFFEGEKQVPGAPYGNTVEHLPAEVAGLYREVQDGMAAGVYTSVVLACRKMLMHIAVEQKAKDGLKFIEYVDYLSEQGYVPPNGKAWVDYIRQKGNEANHEIKMMGREEAERLVTFVEMLLRFVYEFPNKVPKKP